MMKRPWIVLMALVQLVLVGKINARANDMYSIRGHLIGDYENCIVSLFLIDNSIKTLLATDTVKNSKFNFVGKENLSLPATIILDDSKGGLSCDVFLERGNIDILLDGSSCAKGTYLNDLFSNYVLNSKEQDSVLEIEYKTNIEQKELPNTHRFDSLMNVRTEMKREFQTKNINNIVGQTVFLRELGSFWDPMFLQIYDSLPSNIKLEPEVIKYHQMRLEMYESQKVIDAEVGTKIKDIELTTLDGEKVNLSDYIQNSSFTYIDIWASWCGPCLESFPKLELIYNEYKLNGIQILLISIDKTIDSCLDAVKQHDIKFKTLIDLSGGKDLSSVLEFNIIPHGVLIDKEGIIIANQLSNIQLKQKIVELYGK